MGSLNTESDPLERIANTSAACAEGMHFTKPSMTASLIFNYSSCFLIMRSCKKYMKLLVGPELFFHPKTTHDLYFRISSAEWFHTHQDHTAVGGDEESFTAWIPLHDCPLEQGPLRVLEGSHRFGLQPITVETSYSVQGMERGNEWVGGNINAGDVLFLHSLTFHEVMPNRSNRLRISLDCRSQNYQRLVIRRPSSSLAKANAHEKTHTTWTSDELKHYWKKIPLALKPSRCDLAKLAETTESPSMRARYACVSETDRGTTVR
jgi:hypothetical protein